METAERAATAPAAVHGLRMRRFSLIPYDPVMNRNLTLACRTLALCLPLAFVAAPAQAQDTNQLTQQCEKYKTSYDQTYCVAKLFLASDDELNAVYKKLKGKTQGEVQKSLVHVQRDWIKYRNNACESQGTIDVACNYRVNRERTTALRDRLRECETGSCNDALIGKPSWQ